MNDFERFNAMIARRNFVVLDTETTGLRYPAEIIELAIIDPDRKVLLNTRLKPMHSVPAEASRIHGIFDHDLEDCPRWYDVRANMLPIIAGKDVVIYNASYDFGMFKTTDRVWELQPTIWYDDVATFHCAMLWYAQHYGMWNEYRQSYVWQKLTEACNQLAIPVENAHGALGDCLMTIKVIESVIGDL